MKYLLTLFLILELSTVSFSSPISLEYSKLLTLYDNMNEFQKAEFFNNILAMQNNYSIYEQAVELDGRAESGQLRIYLQEQSKIISSSITFEILKHWINIGNSISNNILANRSSVNKVNIKISFIGILMGEYDYQSLRGVWNILQQKESDLSRTKSRINYLIERAPSPSSSNFTYTVNIYKDNSIIAMESIKNNIKIFKSFFANLHLDHTIYMIEMLPSNKQLERFKGILQSLLNFTERKQLDVSMSIRSLSYMETLNESLDNIIQETQFSEAEHKASYDI